jgi:quercetin dioxygenase-like cupin family protein
MIVRIRGGTNMNAANRKPLPVSGLSSVLLVIVASVGGMTLSTLWSSAQSRSQSGNQSGTPASAAGSHAVPFSQSLPQMDGRRLRATLVEVNYEPGESDKPHSHPCPVVGYVARGAIRFQVIGGPEIVYKAGESFYEPPNGVHQVSANASDKEPATLIAYFTCDHETPLTVPPIGEHTGREGK